MTKLPKQSKFFWTTLILITVAAFTNPSLSKHEKIFRKYFYGDGNTYSLMYDSDPPQLDMQYIDFGLCSFTKMGGIRTAGAFGLVVVL